MPYAWQEGSSFSSQERMAREVGVSIRSVRNYIRELEDHGLLIVKQRGHGQTNRYFLPKYGPAKFADQDRSNLAGQDGQDLPPKSTQKKLYTPRKNTEKTQWTEDERAAYFARFMEENGESLDHFLRTNNLPILRTNNLPTADNRD